LKNASVQRNPKFDHELQSMKYFVSSSLQIQVTAISQHAGGNIATLLIYALLNVHCKSELLQGLLLLSAEARHKN